MGKRYNPHPYHALTLGPDSAPYEILTPAMLVERRAGQFVLLLPDGKRWASKGNPLRNCSATL
jgi:hypothetical protein